MPARPVPFLVACGLLLLLRPVGGGEPRPARVDEQGDPLPPGAVARLGTLRFRDEGRVEALAYAPDGKTLAGLYGGPLNVGLVKLWDAHTGKELPQLDHLRQARSLVFSPDSKRVATAGGLKDLDRPAVLWDVVTGKQVRSFGEKQW